MKILVFIEHDIIIRHFLKSRVFDDLSRHHDLTFVFPEKGHKRVSIDPQSLDLNAPIYHLSVNASRLKIWQALFISDTLRFRLGSHFAAIRKFYRNAIGCRAALLYSLLAIPGVFQIFRAYLHLRILFTPHDNLNRLLNEEKPDLLIHPSVLAGVFINDLVFAAHAKKIPLVVIMNSWDNPSTKRAMTGHPNWLLVWGPQTRGHAIELMQMPKAQVVNFGAAQFDLYREPPRIDRGEFCRRHGISFASKILLYAGSSRGADEFEHLRMLEEAIKNGKLGDTVVIYRPHPWGGGGQGGARLLDHPWENVRIESTMRGYLASVKLGDPGITIPDYRDTHDILSSVDAVVSPLSTILIEAAMHGKPILCYLPTEEDNFGNYTRNLAHFDEFFNEEAFLVGHGTDSLIPQVRLLLERVGDSQFSDNLRRSSAHYVSTFEKSYGERLLDFIEGLK